MKYLSVKQMREADRRCIEDLGVPSVVLMNNAGEAVFREIEAGPVGIVCGKGNNGGDGFVVARLALVAGLETRVVLIGDPDSLTQDSAVFRRAYDQLGGRIQVAADEESARRAVQALHDCALLVDALLGTGVNGEIRGPIRAAIDAWPDVPTIAVDIPSGLDADTGQVCGACIKADTTVAIQYPKQGFKKAPAKPYIGRLVVADIGIPPVCADDSEWAKLMDR